MDPSTMGWWYWFGMWIFGIASLVLTWWLFIDAARRKGGPSKYAWPLTATAGLLMQLPAFTISKEAQAAGSGLSAGLAGVLGLVVVSIAVITHFSSGGSGGGSGWSLRTRGDNSVSRGTSDRRRSRVPHASVAVPSTGSGKPVRAKAPSAANPTSSQLEVHASMAPKHPVAPVSLSDPAPRDPTAATLSAPADESAETIVAEDEARQDSASSDTPSAGAPGATLVEDDSTIIEDVDDASAATIVDETTTTSEPGPAPTIIDERSTIVDDEASDITDEDPTGPRLEITDGRTSRIVISDHSGSFVVGRDPARASLAVNDARASRRHFSIVERAGSYMILDLGSSNGTFVNGSLVRDELVLKDGDTIEFGRTVATFRS